MKRKTNINRPEMSADEINQRKNFDSVLNQHIKTTGKPFFKKTWFLSSIAVVTVAIITAVVFVNNNKPASDNQLTVTNVQQPMNSADSLALAAFYAQEEAKPCINPPLNGIDIPFSTYKINTQKGGEISHTTGSKLSIPKNAFVDANGKQIKGDVEIRYREFHDPVDFLVSGIPMTYDSGGTQYHFESAGMMEIVAYQNGEKIEMMPNKTINVELASRDDSPKHNLYKLDTLKNNWSCIGKDKVVKKSEQPAGQFFVGDSTSNNVAPEIAKIETQKVEAKKEKEEKIAALHKLPVQPKKPEQANPESFSNNIDADFSDFPELAVYKGVNWQVGEENKGYDSEKHKYINNTIWESASLKEGTIKDKNYILILRKGSKVEKLLVYPVFEGKNYETALKGFEEKFKQYTTTLEKRTKEEKRIEEEYLAKIAALKKEQEEIARKWQLEEANRMKNMDAQQKIFRTFNVNGFGVYNCDNPMRYPQGVITSAELYTDTKTKLMCYNVYLVDKKLNGMYTYYKNPLTKFTYNPKSENILWTVENGVLYYLKPEDFQNFSSKNSMKEVVMKQIPTEMKTADDIKTFFGI